MGMRLRACNAQMYYSIQFIETNQIPSMHFFRFALINMCLVCTNYRRQIKAVLRFYIMNVVAPIETGHAVQSAKETKMKRTHAAGIVCTARTCIYKMSVWVINNDMVVMKTMIECPSKWVILI